MDCREDALCAERRSAEQKADDVGGDSTPVHKVVIFVGHISHR